ncbi:MAG TPA: HAD family phosphatase [Geobacteraceae bacterium]|nr:HAD family phosphatase [Geobacteraceae bacterium]
MLKAIIFDFDGIIVDTEPIHYQAFQKILEPIGFGYSWEDYVDRYMGFDDREAFREVFKQHSRDLTNEVLESLISKKADIFLEIVRKSVKPYPGVIRLIREISGNLPMALCSGALLSDIVPILGQLGLLDKFDVIITAEDVAASKPDPASYLLAQEKLSSKYPDLNIAPGNCVAIEDTPAGIESARKAGITVLAVTNSYLKEKLVGANHILDSLDNISLKDLKEMMS